MIDALGAVVLAYDKEGDLIHAQRRCVGAQPWDRAARRSRADKGSLRAFRDSLEADGFLAMSRYALQTYEVEVAGDMRESPEAYGLTGNESDAQLADEATQLCGSCWLPFDDLWPELLKESV